MNRDKSLQRLLGRDTSWDLAIIGGGATGVGISVDAASRGFSVCLLEQDDFGKGTSSRSTKLVHGGVRYLRQGKLPLVMEALRERAILRRNAPHLVHELQFIIPCYRWWEAPFYGAGMKIYDLLALRQSFGKSRIIGRDEVLRRIPTIQPKGLRGGVIYRDGQFNDSRLLIDLAFTADEHGAALLNYAKVVGLSHDAHGLVDGLRFVDSETGTEHGLRSRCIINATGAFCDKLRTLDDPSAPPLVAPSQGAHIVLDRSFLPGDVAIMVPRTQDKRVMFAIPWHGHTLLGTTDILVDEVSLDPVPFETEIDFILSTAGQYLAKRPTRADILSTFAGIRPLIKASNQNTSRLSRDHTIAVSRSGFITITGGKWTTYRNMAQECIDHAINLGKLERRECVTQDLKIHGYHPPGGGDLSFHGSAARKIQELIDGDASLGQRYHPDVAVCPAQVLWAVREEMARTLEDVLSRRTRALPLNARAALGIAPAVALDMARELNRDDLWRQSQLEAFTRLAEGYLPTRG